MSLILSPSAAAVAIHLLRGVLYSDSHPVLWQNLLDFQSSIRDYFDAIRLTIVLDESEGYAFLRQCEDAAEPGEVELPRLIQRRPLGYPISLLCVLLRRKIAEQDGTGGETRTIVERDSVVEMLRVFLKDSANEARIVEQIDGHLSKLCDYGLLRKLKGEESVYEVRRVLKSLVDAEWLVEMSEKLEGYRTHARNAL